MPISRDRIQNRHEKPSGGDQAIEAKRSPGRDLVGKGNVPYKPWLASATVLLRTLSAQTLAEFDWHAKGFNKAFREFNDHLIKMRQNPDQHDGQRFRDPDLQSIVVQLTQAALGTQYGDGFADRDGFQRRATIGGKIQTLIAKMAWVPK
jgi:hypothetical protein